MWIDQREIKICERWIWHPISKDPIIIRYDTLPFCVLALKYVDVIMRGALAREQ